MSVSSSAEFKWLEQNRSQTLGTTVRPYYNTSPLPNVMPSGPGAQIIFTIWAVDYPDQQDFLSRQLGGIAAYSPNTSVPDARASSLLRQADALPEWGNRTFLYQQAEQYLVNDAVICPLYQLTNKYALQSWVKGGFDEDIRGLVPNDAWINGYIAKH
jgi:ABC-type oligopeptide transport system substrate-binding subunit